MPVEATIDHVLLVGPEHSGKQTWARQVGRDGSPTVLGEDVEAIEYLAGLEKGALPAVASTMHTVSDLRLTGRLVGGWMFQPGVMSLTHGGVLLLNHIQSFHADVLEKVRRVMILGVVILVDGSNRIEAPAKFRLVATSMACPCGKRKHWDDSSSGCACTSDRVLEHRQAIPEWIRDTCRVMGYDDYRGGLDASWKGESTQRGDQLAAQES